MATVKKKNHGKRVLLVSAKADVGFNIAPPLGLYQLSFFLNERGASCDIFDQELENAEEYIDKAKRGYYGAIGFSLSRISVTPESMRFSLDLIWRFRRAVEKSGFGAFFIAGGQEAALNYKQWLTLGIELIFLGFAEKPMLEFCRRLEKKNDWDGSSSERDSFLEGMHGITFINATGDITYNPSEQFREGEFKEMFYDQIMKIDVPYEKYWDIYRNKASKVNAGGSKFIVENVRLYTASHCPRRCGFCNSQNF
ncbi:MAG TPA: hypothetical protein HPQ00_03460, partial [Magnetococcales bacterium]|nr:hypothetical protein [Magnetococcales bacterium]